MSLFKYNLSKQKIVFYATTLSMAYLLVIYLYLLCILFVSVLWLSCSRSVHSPPRRASRPHSHSLCHALTTRPPLPRNLQSLASSSMTSGQLNCLRSISGTSCEHGRQALCFSLTSDGYGKQCSQAQHDFRFIINTLTLTILYIKTFYDFMKRKKRECRFSSLLVKKKKRTANCFKNLSLNSKE